MNISFLNLFILNMLSYSSDHQSAEVSVIAQHNGGAGGTELVWVRASHTISEDIKDSLEIQI